MKTNGGFLVTKIKQLGDRIFEKILSEKNIDPAAVPLRSPVWLCHLLRRLHCCFWSLQS